MIISLLGLIKYLELIAALTGSIYYKKYSNSFLKYFLYLLWFIVGLEFTVWAIKECYDATLQNNFIYNVATSIQYGYFFLLYYKSLNTQKYKKWVLYFLLTFIVSVVINFIWGQKLMITGPFHSYTFTLGAILLIISIALFFAEILNSEKVLYFKRYLMFWISVGLVLFYSGIIPFVLSLNFLPALLSSDSLSIIFFTLNFMMYTCFTIGFIVSRKYTD